MYHYIIYIGSAFTCSYNAGNKHTKYCGVYLGPGIGQNIANSVNGICGKYYFLFACLKCLNTDIL